MPVGIGINENKDIGDIGDILISRSLTLPFSRVRVVSRSLTLPFSFPHFAFLEGTSCNSFPHFDLRERTPYAKRAHDL